MIARIRLAMSGVGLTLIAAFFALDGTSNTIRVRFVPPWDASNPGELYFWLAAILFLLPGCTLLGASLGELLARPITGLRARLLATDSRERRVLVLTLFLVSWSLARIGNQVFLQGQPFTDDEDAARFGGQVLAQGTLWSPLPPLRQAFPELFLFQRDGAWTSFDFLGALLPWTLAELTHSDTLVFSLMAAVAPASVALVAMRFHGPFVGLFAGLLLLCSPMALTLSFSSHAHVVSRGFLALGLGLSLFVMDSGLGRGIATGLALALALLTRPPETIALIMPLLLGWTYEAVGQPAQRKRLLGIALGALPLVLIMLGYNYALSGGLGFLRSAANEIAVPYGKMMGAPFAFDRWPNRFGNNLSYNTLMLAIWFLGPLGLWLAWLGARSSRTHALLGCGVLAALGLCLLHDDRGLHMVGPIHLSETAVPLTILAVAGIVRVLAALERLEIKREMSIAGLLGYALLGLVTFAMWHTRALAQQAAARAKVVTLAEHVPQRPAVVLARPFSELRADSTPYGRVGSFVFEWRRARPDLSDEVLILLDSIAAREHVTQAFPGRTPYVFDPRRYGVFPVTLAEAKTVDRVHAESHP